MNQQPSSAASIEYRGPRDADGQPLRCPTCGNVLRDIRYWGYSCDCLWGHPPTADEVADTVEFFERFGVAP